MRGLLKHLIVFLLNYQKKLFCGKARDILWKSSAYTGYNYTQVNSRRVAEEHFRDEGALQARI